MKKNWKIARFFTGALAVVAASALVNAAPASAGTNGQHVRACNVYQWGVLIGLNQDGHPIQKGMRNTDRDGCIVDYGWWKGAIQVFWYTADKMGNPVYVWTGNGNVPANQGSNDWYRFG